MAVKKEVVGDPARLRSLPRQNEFPFYKKCLIARFVARAHVAELADAYGSGPYGATRGGSSPLVSISPADGRPFLVWNRF